VPPFKAKVFPHKSAPTKKFATFTSFRSKGDIKATLTEGLAQTNRYHSQASGGEKFGGSKGVGFIN